MADIRALHRPWCAAIATGLLQVGDGSVTAPFGLNEVNRRLAALGREPA